VSAGSRLARWFGGSLLWPMLRKEFIQMRRDRLTLGMMVGIPAVQLMLFGFAIRTEVRHLQTVVLDESRTSDSRALVAVMENTGNFSVVARVTSRRELEEWLKRGDARAGVVIPPAFATELKRGRTATAQVIVDAADPMASSAALSGASLAAASRSVAIAAARSPQSVRGPPLEVRLRPWYNPALRSAAYIVPGIIGVLLSMTMLIITSLAIVRERERGTLEQLVVTPVGKTSIMLGKVLPFVVVGYVQMSVVLVLGKLLFDVPMRGSLVLLYVLSAAFIVAMLGFGLLISTVARNQLQGMQIGFFVMLPSLLLSGFMFPREAMPVAAQLLGLLLPLTFYLEILRGVLLKGLGLEYLWRDALALAGFAVVLLGLSVARFSKTLE
jgi:ABC-2 type transport system permease protein